MRTWEVNLGLSLGGAVRALAIGVLLVALPLVVDVPINEPSAQRRGGARAGAVLLPRRHRRHLRRDLRPPMFVNNIVILPLHLPRRRLLLRRQPARRRGSESPTLNPLFYLVDAVRYGFLGTGDVSPLLSLGVTAAADRGARWPGAPSCSAPDGGSRPSGSLGSVRPVFTLNVPNLLTVLRILLVPVLVVALLGETPNGDLLAAVVFALAALHRRARRLHRALARQRSPRSAS